MAEICEHSPSWATSTSAPGIREWQQGRCSRCETYAIYLDGEWHFAEPPRRLLQVAAERDEAVARAERAEALLERAKAALHLMAQMQFPEERDRFLDRMVDELAALDAGGKTNG